MSGEPARPRRSRKSIAFQPNTSGAAKDTSKSAEAPVKRKSRSKSLGPGGLDALNAEEKNKKDVLKNGNGNGRRTSVAPVPQVKSILMPTLPLLPLKEIPAHRPRTQLRGAPPAEWAAPSSQQPASIFQPPLPPPGQPTATVPLRTEEEQQKRAEILAARAARRQSLGNRRVSFAPEATLHTWDVIDYRHDAESTPGSSVGGSSRASTPASNRRSSGAGAQATPTPGEPPSTPPDQINHDLPEAPGSARAEHQKRNRRTPVTKTPPMNFSNPDGEFVSSSPFSSPTGNEAAFVEEEASNSDSSDDMDEDATSGERTFISVAGETTMGEGELTLSRMDTDDEDEITRKPIFKKPMQWSFEGGPSSSPPVPKSEPALFAAVQAHDGEGEMTMNITKAIGGLLSTSKPAKPPKFSFSPKTPQKADDDGEMTMDMTRPVGGLLVSRPAVSQHQREEEGEDVMDFTRPIGRILSAAAGKDEKSAQEDEDVDMTMEMDITRPIGGILGDVADKLRKSIGFHTAQQHQPQSELDEMDMDITRPLGGIVSAAQLAMQTRAPSPTPTTTSETDLNEDMTMEFTSVLGGIVDQEPKQNGRRRSPLGIGRRGGFLMSGDNWAKDQAELIAGEQRDDEMETDLSVAVGRILPSAEVDGGKISESEVAYPTLNDSEKVSEPVAYPVLPETHEEGGGQEIDESISMEMTVNLGHILQNRPETVRAASPQPAAALALTSEPVSSLEETSAVDLPPVNKRTSRRSSGAASTTTTQRLTRGAHRRSLELQQKESTLQAPPKNNFTPEQPSAKKATPGKTASIKIVSPQQNQETPQTKNTTVPKIVALQEAEVPTPQIKAESVPTTPQPSTSSKKRSPTSSTVKTSKAPTKRTPNPSTPYRTPRRRGTETTTMSGQFRTPLGGVGLDRPGLGSPAISLKLSCRKSLSDDTTTFSPIALPSALIVACRMDAQKREREAEEDKHRRDQEEKAMDLKSKIQLLTPIKPTGRMGLAIGSLGSGKRPLEDAVEHGKKRRKSADGVSALEVGEKMEMGMEMEGWASGLTKVITPPTGPLAPLLGNSKKCTPKIVTAQKTSASSTPISGAPAQVRIAVSFGDDKSAESSMLEGGMDEEADSISLQEFLRAIDISFLELTATKRRHTSFKTASTRRSANIEDEEASLADRIKAGACTAPMLEMFQHLSRDLEKHIEEGREVVNDIEEITQAENPPLFKEYIQAPADVRAVMDIQFKDIKTNARLTAKGEWYEWRMKNMGPVKETLQRNLKGLQEDERFVEEQMTALTPLLPDIKKAWEKARYQLRKLEEMKQRIDMDNQDDLLAARSRMNSILSKIETVRAEAQQKRQQAQEMDNEIKVKEAREAKLVASIEEAERIKEMNRGWSENEVRAWKTRCSELEKSSGWSITKAPPGGRLEMMFMRQIRLLLDPMSQAAPTVEYICPVKQKLSDYNPLPDAESKFFITGLNAILTKERNPKVVLRNVASYWQDALAIVDNIRRLRSHHYTEVEIANDGNLHVRATVLVQELRSKMEVSFEIGKRSLSSQGAGVRVVYGAISQQAVQDALMNWGGEWREGVSEVVERCLEGRRKGGIAVGVKG